MPWNEVMSKFKSGALKSGGSGKKVSNPKQAVAIMLSEKRQAATKPEYRLSSDAAAKIRAKAKGGK